MFVGRLYIFFGEMSLFINICIALSVRKMLQKDSKDKIFALEELRASKQIVTWQGDKYSLKHLLIAHQLPGAASLGRQRWMRE